MRLCNYEVKSLYDFLLSIELSGKQNRMRTRFCRLLENKLQEIDVEKEQLIKQFAEIDEHGNVKTVELPENKKKYLIQNMDGFGREYELLMREPYILDETEERQDILETVADIVLSCNQSFSGQEAIQYDRFCEVFEMLTYEKKA